ncbi:MAG: shikimate dehydrogenase [Lachnospiraceae bacterium]|nr:shikimate dehydrogenase [Lachnospiraceae bacterium]
MKYGLIGEKLGHSYSKRIHEAMRQEAYELKELSREEFPEFMKERAFAGINVTIPYKQAVIPYLDRLDDAAARIGAVNTVVCRDGELWGYNTDYYGFAETLHENRIDVAGRKVLVLGNGGAAKAVLAVFEDEGAGSVLTVKYKREPGCLTYEEAACAHADADVIVNTSPVGMFPNCDASPMSLTPYKNLCAVCDLIYNPPVTRLLSDAAAQGAAAVNGLRMLVLQAKKASELFFGDVLPMEAADKIYGELL